MPLWLFTLYSIGMTKIVSLSGASGIAPADFMTACLSASVISGFSPLRRLFTLTTPIELIPRTWSPLIPQTTASTSRPDLSTASSTAFSIQRLASSLFIIMPLRIPSDGDLPMPRILSTGSPFRSTEPSPITAVTFTVPISRPTTMLLFSLDSITRPP